MAIREPASAAFPPFAFWLTLRTFFFAPSR